MHILVTGVKGQLGYDVVNEAEKRGIQATGVDVEVTPVSSDEFPAKAKRPSNSRMSKVELDKNGFDRLPDWEDALSRYLKTIR